MAIKSRKQKERDKEFKMCRTSWKFFERHRQNSIKYRLNKEANLEVEILIEILKELQYQNDK